MSLRELVPEDREDTLWYPQELQKLWHSLQGISRPWRRPINVAILQADDQLEIALLSCLAGV